MKIAINKLETLHWPAVSRIYQDGIKTGNATFEQNSPEWEVWDKGHLKACRIVAVADGKVAGWAALSAISQRCVYGGVCEVSVYVAEDFRGRGVGRILLKALIDASEKNGIWTLQAGIFPENKASISLHKSMGFREVGVREKIGRMNDVWRDVVLLEKRSKKI
ncbi:GNAT family N-acetyltransferase [Prolixibacteraceae bacterium Z1-6]|uniref:GNAT family N-acetyltransferase n=1 Tax=Draconibacterium aestuarii TaxID=2998507 RepID=A0A9X3F665_9BACT|nr:GNAT family N-acetyltransferase [Prolixibacteraceae bacterium Z1-6]